MDLYALVLHSHGGFSERVGTFACRGGGWGPDWAGAGVERYSASGGATLAEVERSIVELFAPALAALEGARALWRDKPLLKKMAVDILVPFLMLGVIVAIMSFFGMGWHYARQDGLAHGLAEAFRYTLEFGAMTVLLFPLLVAIGIPLFFLTTGMFILSFISPLWLVWALSGPIEPKEPVRPQIAVGKQI